MSPRARPRAHLVTGVTGQDGIWLARHLVGAGARVIGTTRSAAGERGCYLDGIELVELDIRDTHRFAELLDEFRPDVVHNLAALTSVGASWQAVDEVSSADALAVEQMVEVLLARGDAAPALVHASSSEIFGPADPELLVDEHTPVNPVSPYGEAKARAHAAVQAGRAAGLQATNLILFGHTSVLHPPRFAIPSLARQAAEVALGRRDRVSLHNPATTRDWGSASDFVRAFAAAAGGPAGDYVIATGELHSLAELARHTLDALGVPAAAVVASDAPARPNDFDHLRGDHRRASEVLGWRPARSILEEVAVMARVELERLSSGLAESPAYVG